MRFSMILEMVDRLSAPAKRARAGVSGLRDTARTLGQQMRRTSGDLDRGDRSLSGVARSGRRVAALGLRQAFERAGAGARKLGRDLRDLERRLKLAERAGFATGRGLRKLGGAGLGMLKNGLLGAGAAAAGAGSFALFDLFRTAGQFEQYQAMLEGTEGSAQAAQKSMSWVTQFAKETPYELDQVMEAFVSLKAYGIDPMDGSLRALGDAASGMSKPLSSAVEAMADAMTGEYERLKEFSIRAKKEGDRTTFSYVKNGKTITRVAKGQGAAIQEALVGIFNERFGGGMQRQATTLFGIISNLKGMWSEFLLMVAKAGIFDFVKRKLQGLLDRVNEMAASGELQKWAQTISDKMIKAWEWGEKFINSDWDATAQEFRDIAEAIGVVADGILALKRAKDWLDETDKASDEFFPNGLRTLKGEGREPGEVPVGAEMMRVRGVRLPAFNRQPSVDVGGTIKIDVSSSSDLKVRATPVQGSGWSVPAEVRTGRYMRSPG